MAWREQLKAWFETRRGGRLSHLFSQGISEGKWLLALKVTLGLGEA